MRHRVEVDLSTQLNSQVTHRLTGFDKARFAPVSLTSISFLGFYQSGNYMLNPDSLTK